MPIVIGICVVAILVLSIQVASLSARLQNRRGLPLGARALPAGEAEIFRVSQGLARLVDHWLRDPDIRPFLPADEQAKARHLLAEFYADGDSEDPR